MSTKIIDFPPRPTRRGFISIGAAASTVVAGLAPPAEGKAAASDPILELIAQESAATEAAYSYRAAADKLVFGIDEKLRRRLLVKPETELPAPIGPLYAAACHHEKIAGGLFDRVVETRATTIEGVLAKAELLLINPQRHVDSVLADLRALASGGVA